MEIKLSQDFIELRTLSGLYRIKYISGLYRIKYYIRIVYGLRTILG